MGPLDFSIYKVNTKVTSCSNAQSKYSTLSPTSTILDLFRCIICCAFVSVKLAQTPIGWAGK